MTTAAIQTTRIGTAVLTLMANQRKKAGDVAAAIGMPRSTFYTKCQAEGWTALEVMHLATFFGVPVGVLYRDPADLIDTTSRFFRQADVA